MSNGMCSPPTEDRELDDFISKWGSESLQSVLAAERAKLNEASELLLRVLEDGDPSQDFLQEIDEFLHRYGFIVDSVDSECPDCEGRGCVECGGNPSQE
jgi:hypothetical protein